MLTITIRIKETQHDGLAISTEPDLTNCTELEAMAGQIYRQHIGDAMAVINSAAEEDSIMETTGAAAARFTRAIMG